MKLKKLHIFFITFTFCTLLYVPFVWAQGEKEMTTAVDLMTSEKYDEALSILYQLNSQQIKPFFKDSQKYSFFVDSQFVSLEQIYIKYLIAVCLLEKGEYSRNALSYIEYIMAAGYSYLPDIVYKDLGKLYYLEQNFEKSHYYFSKYLEKINSNDEFYAYSKQMQNIVNFARRIQADTLYEDPIQFDNRFQCKGNYPLVLVTKSANAMYYASIDSNQQNGTYHTIMVSYRTGKYWKKPRMINFPEKLKALVPYMRLAGLDASRENPVIIVEKADSAIAFIGRISDYACIDFKKTDFNFIQKYDHSIFQTEDGKSVYFSGKRDDTKGGYDLYKVQKSSTGKWGKPINLGNEINSPADEITPFYDSHLKRLYYSTNGYQSLGGFDIQYTSLEGENAFVPFNMGFPINSIFNDIGFNQPDAINFGFWYRDGVKNTGKSNIFTVNMGGTIPLTFLNGTFLAGNPPRPVAVNLLVIDKLLQTQVKYTFTPENRIGKYFAFFKPGREYDLIIDAKGFLPQTISIYVPKQSYFYEIFQEIELIPDNSENLIQQEVTVRNYFNPIENDSVIHTDAVLFNTINSIKNLADSITNISEQEEKEKNYNDLLDLLDEAISTTDSVLLNQIDHNSRDANETKQTTVIDKSANHMLVPIIMGNDTLYSMPRILTYDQENLHKTILKTADDNTSSKQQLIFETFFYYNQEEYTIHARFLKVIQDISQLMTKQQNITAEIIGYKLPGESDNDIAYKRGLEIYEKLKTDQCKCQHVIIKTTEATFNNNTADKLSKVRIRLYKSS